MNTSPLRILLLTWDFPPARGGIQTWMYELATRLPDADVTVITTAAAHPFEANRGISIMRLGSSRLGRWPWVAHVSLVTLFKCLVRRPDLILCGHVVTMPAALISRWTLGIPVVTFAYAWEVRRRRGGAVSFLLKSATLVLAISRFTERAVAAQGVAADRIRVLYPGVDVDRFNGPSHVSPGTRQRRTILTVSRLNERYKGHDVVIRALPLVRAACGDVQYVVAGDGCLRGFLSTLAASVGVADSVQFLGDVSDAALVDLIRSCDVLVQMSRESLADGGAEGFGIVCLEAGAAAKPVIAGRSGGLTDAVVDNLSGLLVDPNDVGAITDAIVSVLSDHTLADRLGQQGQVRVRQSFTWDQMAQNARRLLGEVAGKPGPEPCVSST